MPLLSAKMLWLLLMVMPLGGANTSDQRVSTVAPPHRISHQQQRLHQLEAAQQHQQQRHHHLRHELHLRAELEGNGNHQPPPMGGSEGDLTAFEKTFESQLPMQQHHLRHHNRHHQSWEQRVFPALRHQQHRLAAAAVGTSTPRTVFTTESPTTSHRGLVMNHTRYFDRDGMNPPWAEYHTTRGPNWRQELDTSDSDEESDEDDDDEDEEYDYNDDSSSNAVDEELARQMPRYSLFSQKLPRAMENREMDREYDQSDELELAGSRNRNSNRHPSVANPHDKPAEKRHIFDWLFKQDKEKDVTKKPHTTAPPKTTTTTTTSTTTHRPERQTLTLVDANLQANLQESDPGEDYSNEDTDSETEEAFSNEQWNKIEHDHHLRQQKHQKELQALREKSRNTPLIRNEVPPSHDNIETEVSRPGMALRSLRVAIW